MNLIESALAGLAQDKAIERSEEYAGEHFQPTRDPFYENTTDGKQHRRRLPDFCTKEESKNWKSIQNKAWLHDKSLCGCCCWTENIGWAPVLVMVPVIGPALMYWVHNKLITMANKKYDLPTDLLVKLHSNIVIDLCISLIPILGSIFAWLSACSTRNAAMIYNFVCKRALERHNNEQREKYARDNMMNNKLQNAKSRQQLEPQNVRNNSGTQNRPLPVPNVAANRNNNQNQQYGNKSIQRTPYPPEQHLRNIQPHNQNGYSQQNQNQCIQMNNLPPPPTSYNSQYNSRG